MVFVFIFIFMGFYGESFLFEKTNFYDLYSYQIYLGILLLISLLYSIKSIHKIISNSSAKLFFKANFELIVFAVMTWFLLFLDEDDFWIKENVRIIFFIYGIIFSKITIDMMIAFIVKENLRFGILEIWITLLYFSIYLGVFFIF